MYQFDYERYVWALWDEKLKEDIHENFYTLLALMTDAFRGRSGPAEFIEILKGPPKGMIEIMAKYLIDLEEPDPFELESFIVKHIILIKDRIVDILDPDEIKVQVKRRGLVR